MLLMKYSSNLFIFLESDDKARKQNAEFLANMLNKVHSKISLIIIANKHSERQKHDIRRIVVFCNHFH